MSTLTSPSKSRKTSQPVVVYHSPCPDGGFGALAAYLRLGPQVKWVPFRYEVVVDVIGQVEKTSTVYCIDCCPNDLLQICEKAEHVILLDHHKTAFEKLDQIRALGDKAPKNLETVLVLEQSGATIAYNYFTKGKDNSGYQPLLEQDDSREAKLRELFAYVEDNDLWKHKLEHSKAFSSGLGTLNVNFNVNENPGLFDQLLAIDKDDVIKRGLVKLETDQKLIEEEMQSAYVVQLGLGKFGSCLAVETKYPNLRSGLGNALATKSKQAGLRAIAAVLFTEPEMDQSMVKVSLRSLGDEDTATISKQYGGGGHLNASSFVLSKQDWQTWQQK